MPLPKISQCGHNTPQLRQPPWHESFLHLLDTLPPTVSITCRNDDFGIRKCLHEFFDEHGAWVIRQCDVTGEEVFERGLDKGVIDVGRGIKDGYPFFYES